MAFGQAAGPPASAKDIAHLAELVERRGFDSFKEARHPLGLSQRQAAGKFTRDEVESLVNQLEAEDHDPDTGDGAGESDPVVEREVPTPRPATKRIQRDQKLVAAGLTDELLVAELELRGWTCIAPTPPC